MARWLARGIIVAAALCLLGIVVVEAVVPDPVGAAKVAGLASVLGVLVWAVVRVESEGW